MAPKLDKPPSSLTVPLLRAELAKREIATTGMLKAELVARLTEALAAEGGGGGDVDGDAEMVIREGRPLVFASLGLVSIFQRLRPIRIEHCYAPGLEK